MEERREWRLQDLFFTNGLVLCGELDVDLRLNIRYFFKYAKEIIRNSGVGGETIGECGPHSSRIDHNDAVGSSYGKYQ